MSIISTTFKEVPMDISITEIDKKNQVVTARIKGDFSDIESLELFRKFIRESISKGICKINLNLSGIRMVNCSAIGCLCSELKRLKGHQGTIVAYELTRELDELFRITRLNKSIRTFCNRQQAFSYLNENC